MYVSHGGEWANGSHGGIEVLDQKEGMEVKECMDQVKGK